MTPLLGNRTPSYSLPRTNQDNPGDSRREETRISSNNQVGSSKGSSPDAVSPLFSSGKEVDETTQTLTSQKPTSGSISIPSLSDLSASTYSISSLSNSEVREETNNSDEDSSSCCEDLKGKHLFNQANAQFSCKNIDEAKKLYIRALNSLKKEGIQNDYIEIASLAMLFKITFKDEVQSRENLLRSLELVKDANQSNELDYTKQWFADLANQYLKEVNFYLLENETRSAFSSFKTSLHILKKN